MRPYSSNYDGFYLSARSEDDIGSRTHLLGIIVPRWDAVYGYLPIAVSFVLAENYAPPTDLRGKVVKLVKDFGLEDALLEALLFAEGVLVL
jgi:hypothetical protein